MNLLVIIPIINVPCTLEEFIQLFDCTLDDIPYVSFEGVNTRKLVTEWTDEAAADLRKLMKEYH